MRVTYNYTFRRRPNEVQHREDGTTLILLERRNGDKFHCVIDTIDYESVKSYRWHVIPTKRIIYIRASFPDNKFLYLHKLLVPDCEEVDHKDHDGLNNRRNNLRPATEVQNKQNRRKSIGKSSSYRGVNFESKCWRVKIMANGKPKHVGCFENEIEAAKAYDSEAKKLHGEFAELNFPEKI